MPSRHLKKKKKKECFSVNKKYPHLAGPVAAKAHRGTRGQLQSSSNISPYADVKPEIEVEAESEKK